MITPQELVTAFERNLSIIKSETEGLSHADSVLQPPFRGNCLNWVLGHIVGSRNTIVQALGAEALVSEAQAARYGYGSEPVLEDGDDLIPFDTLLALLDASQATFSERLSGLTEEELAKPVECFLDDATLGKLLFFLYFHETFHTGQTEQLRQLAGKNDKVL